MKTKYKFNIIIALIFAFININSAFAQNFIAANTNDLIADNNVHNVVNTGNDIIICNLNNNYIRIGRFNNPALISPNPATNYIQLNLGQEIEIAKIVIYDASGRIILEDDYFELNSRIQTDNFEQGVYFIRIIADNYNKTSKFIIL